MPQMSRTFRNFLNLGVAQLITAAAGMITAIILGRTLEPDMYGILGFATAFLSFFGLFVNMGTDVYGMREAARDPEIGGKLTCQIFSMRLCLAGTAIILAMFIGWIAEFSAVKLTIVGIQAAGLISVALVADFYFQGVERMELIAARQIGAALTSASAVALLIRTPDDLYIAATIPVVTNTLSAGALLYLFRKESALSIFTLDIRKSVEIIKKSMPFAVTAFMSAIYFNLDLVMLGFMRTDAEIGHYSAAVRVMLAALILGNLFRTSYLPPLSRTVDDNEKARYVFRRYCRAIFFVALPVVFFGYLFAADILHLLFGHSYLGGISALQILMVAVCANYIVMAFGAPLVVWNRERTFTKAVTIGAGINLVLNFILIPRYGIEGAAVATLAAQLSVGGICCLAHRKFIRNTPAGELVKFGMSSTLAVGICWLGFQFSALSSLSIGFNRLIYAVPVYSLTYLLCVSILSRGAIKEIIRTVEN